MEGAIALAGRHSAYSDPGVYRERWDVLPPDATVAEIGAVVRNLLFHYRADGIDVVPERRGDVDARWTECILALDAERHPEPIDAPRERADRVAGCCRDFSLLTVSALRERGVPARSRVGFAGYFGADGFHHDHVVVEWWSGARWVRTDAQLDPAWYPFDTLDLPRGSLDGFASAAEVWTALREEEADPDSFGVAPGSPIRGTTLVHDYVIRDVASRFGDELLLWDDWGGMLADGAVSHVRAEAMDQLAQLVIAADGGDTEAEAELAERYRHEAGLRPCGHVRQFSPFGEPARDVRLDREATGARPRLGASG